MKKKFSTELAYVLGIVLVAWGVVLMEKADFGVSMVVAPAYLLYRWLSPAWHFFTFGMAEYCLQAVLLLAMSLLLRRFRISYLFSFVTAVVYGVVLDALMFLGTMLPSGGIALRGIYYAAGMLFCAAGVSAMFHTYISPEVYELFVKEVSAHFGVDINRFKTGYDCASCLLGVAMSFLAFGPWRFMKSTGPSTTAFPCGNILCRMQHSLLRSVNRLSLLLNLYGIADVLFTFQPLCLWIEITA